MLGGAELFVQLRAFFFERFVLYFKLRFCLLVRRDSLFYYSKRALEVAVFGILFGKLAVLPVKLRHFKILRT